MSSAYDYNLSAEAVRSLLSASPAKRRSVWAVIDLLTDNPFLEHDLSERAPSDRTYFVIVRDNIVITYWVDHSVRELRIMRLEFV